MARTIARLKPRQVSNARPRRGRTAILLSDGGNLYLQCTLGADAAVRRSWLFRYELDGRRREMGLGPLHTVGLAEARERARNLRQQLLDGIDPLDTKRRERDERRLEAAKAMTFSACVEAYLQAHDAAWKNKKHRQQWKMTLTNYCKAISDLPVRDINTDHVLRVLTPLWTRRTETAKRPRGRIERVLAWAKGRELRSGENPARWEGHLDEMLAAPSKVAKVKHLAAMPYVELPQFFVELSKREAISAKALTFTILTAARSGETRLATVNEIDLDAAIWTVPSERMKSDRDHRVPLTKEALALLRGLKRGKENNTLLFPNSLGNPLSDTAMRKYLQEDMGCAGLTVHGFRSSFKDWASERTGFPNEVSEAALAHVVGDKTEAAYRRGDALAKRRKLMEAWAAFCSKPAPTGTTVTPMRASV